jgi:hypothetical protein
MHQETQLIKEARLYAEKLHSASALGQFPYHILALSLQVVKAAREIGEKSSLKKKELETVQVAAWLQHVGYCKEVPPENAHEGADLARQFLTQQGVGEGRIQNIIGCILATRMPQQPENQLARVLCDADLYYLSTRSYEEHGQRIRQELTAVEKREISKLEWQENYFGLLRSHRYFTAYGRQTLQVKQEKNLRRLEKKMQHESLEAEKENNWEAQSWEAKQEAVQGDSAPLNKPGRGVETMFRTTSANQMLLSEMADNKANIMISINAITISLLISVLIRKFEEFPNLIIPTALLTSVCLITIVFAVLATRPNIASGSVTRQDIRQQKTNLLFFGNFYRMSLPDYMWGMHLLMSNKELLYDSLIQDIYFTGQVLGKKYQLLRIAYSVFLYGYVLSVVLYALALILFPTTK